LDPSVRKVEWSREEEEKLLHLAKLMPAQWKTIGPLVGRTATQCQEHYERLLDEAAGGKEGDTEDLRSQAQQTLRAGQIDSHPESKPARPDPIDMDEDEIEMLQEARARLANTQGKKAKRKAREKMLAQAKRLADLQKRRELKQAGLLSSQAKKKARKRNRDIDLGVEIPFHKPAPAGFHDVGAEDERAERLRKKQMSQIDFKKLNEQQYHSRDREAAQAKKREEARLRTLEKSNMQYVVAQVSKKNDPLNIRKRGPLNLPEPSVTDQELNQIAKFEKAQRDQPALMGGSEATEALLGDYSDRPLPTPMRTPMTGAANSATSKQQSIMREASNLRMLERGQTPLLGGENPEMEIDEEEDSKPAASNLSASTPAAPDRGGVGQTPRDQLGLNRPMSELRGSMDDSASVGASTFATSQMSIREIAREERRAAKRARKQLEEALAALPAPQYEYELAAPADMEIDDDAKPVVETVEEDAADVEARERARLQKEADKLYEARSSVVKRRDLPRPIGSIPESVPISLSKNSEEKLIDSERMTLLRHDAHAFPVEPPLSLFDGKKKSKKKKKETSSELELPPETPLDFIPEKDLNRARSIIQDETDALLKEKTAAVIKSGSAESEASALDQVLAQNIDSLRGQKGTEIFTAEGWKPKKSKNEELQSMLLEFEMLQEASSALRKKNEKTESKVVVLTGGLAKRAQTLQTEILHVHAELQNAAIEATVYESLKDHEERGGAKRINTLRTKINSLSNDSAALDATLRELVEQKQANTPPPLKESD
jgi:pre-mRNA-splicing factor CDC5/CEF1